MINYEKLKRWQIIVREMPKFDIRDYELCALGEAERHGLVEHGNTPGSAAAAFGIDIDDIYYICFAEGYPYYPYCSPDVTKEHVIAHIQEVIDGRVPI